MGLNILLTRIDNRLVHGQVGITWTKSTGANLIVVVDDEAANDNVQQQLMKMTAESSGADIRFFTVEKTISVIHKASDREIVRKLVDGKVPVDKLNVGNMHSSPGKRQITKKVYVDDKDMEDLKYLKEKGIDIFIQDVPDDTKIPIDNFINS